MDRKSLIDLIESTMEGSKTVPSQKLNSVVAEVCRRCRLYSDLKIEYPLPEEIVWRVIRNLEDHAREGSEKTFQAKFLVRTAEREMGFHPPPRGTKRPQDLAHAANEVAAIGEEEVDLSRLGLDRQTRNSLIERMAEGHRVVLAAQLIIKVSSYSKSSPQLLMWLEETLTRSLYLKPKVLSAYLEANTITSEDRPGRLNASERHRTEFSRSVSKEAEQFGWSQPWGKTKVSSQSKQETCNMNRFIMKLSFALGAFTILVGLVAYFGAAAIPDILHTSNDARIGEPVVGVQVAVTHGQIRETDVGVEVAVTHGQIRETDVGVEVAVTHGQIRETDVGVEVAVTHGQIGIDPSGPQFA